MAAFFIQIGTFLEPAGQVQRDEKAAAILPGICQPDRAQQLRRGRSHFRLGILVHLLRRAVPVRFIFPQRPPGFLIHSPITRGQKKDPEGSLSIKKQFSGLTAPPSSATTTALSFTPSAILKLPVLTTRTSAGLIAVFSSTTVVAGPAPAKIARRLLT